MSDFNCSQELSVRTNDNQPGISASELKASVIEASRPFEPFHFDVNRERFVIQHASKPIVQPRNVKKGYAEWKKEEGKTNIELIFPRSTTEAFAAVLATL